MSRFSINRQYTLFYLLCSLFLLSCTNNPGHKSVPEAAPIYLNSNDTLQFLPDSLNDADIETGTISLSNRRFQQFTLKNGLIIYYLPDDNLPNINIAVIVDAGKYQFNSKDERLSPLVLKLLKQGTHKYSRAAFQKRMSLLGKPMDYRQTAQYSVISAEILPQDFELALDLIAQQLKALNPGSEALRKVLEQQLLENKLTQSSGAYLAKLLFYQNNYPPEHLYYHLQPDSDEIKKVTIDDLMDFYQKKYKPQRSRIIISGDIEPKLLKQQIEAFFSDWISPPSNNVENQTLKKTGQLEPELVPSNSFFENKAADNKSHFDFIERKGSQQVDLLYGVVTVPRQSADWLSLKIIASLIGGGPSSRLFADLREKQGLAYFISARQLAGRYSSPFLIQTSVAHNKLIPAINGINNHINSLCHNKIKKHELEQIKQQLSGETVFKLQTNQQLVNNKIHQLENILADDYLLAEIKKIKMITAKQLFIAANKYLCGKHNIIAVGQTNKLEKTFRNELTDYVYQEHYLPLH